MVQHINIPGYISLKEVGNIYQWISGDESTPKTILLRRFRGVPIVFKGYLYYETKEYVNLDVESWELMEIEQLLGKATLVDLKEFIEGTILKECEIFSQFTEIIG